MKKYKFLLEANIEEEANILKFNCITSNLAQAKAELKLFCKINNLTIEIDSDKKELIYLDTVELVNQ